MFNRKVYQVYLPQCLIQVVGTIHQCFESSVNLLNSLFIEDVWDQTLRLLCYIPHFLHFVANDVQFFVKLFKCFLNVPFSLFIKLKNINPMSIQFKGILSVSTWTSSPPGPELRRSEPTVKACKSRHFTLLIFSCHVMSCHLSQQPYDGDPAVPGQL